MAAMREGPTTPAELAKLLAETFDNPEVNFVTFERDDDNWNMRRFTRKPPNLSPENTDG